MRRMILIAALAIVGCGQAAPPQPGTTAGQFEDEAQELRYLKTLSNPTPEQFKRREALEQAIEAAERRERLDRTEGERLMNRAHQLFREGDLDAAIRACDEALAESRFHGVHGDAKETRKALLDLRETRRKAAGK